MRRKFNVLLQTALLFLAAISLLLGFNYVATGRSFDFGRFKSSAHDGWTDHRSANTTGKYKCRCSLILSPDTKVRAADKILPDPASSIALKDGNSTLLQIAPSYIKAIMTPEDNSFSRLDCPVLGHDRYDYLRNNYTKPAESNGRLKYFFALDLHQCVGLLPRLLGSIVETIRFLGPDNCALSVVEGRSEDGTFEVLELLREEMSRIGAKYF